MADPHCRSRNEGLGWQTLEWVSGDVAVGMSIPRKPRCMTKSGHLDPRLTSLLQSLRERIRRYVVWDSLLAVAAVVFAAFWLGLALDYLPVQLGGTEMPRLARSLLLLIVAAIVLAILIRMLIGRLSRPLPDDSLALLVERHHPKLGGRLVTAVQLNEPGRQGDSHSSLLLQEVHEQAAAAIDEVDPNRVFRREPLVRKAMIAGPLALCALAVSDHQSPSLWPRRIAIDAAVGRALATPGAAGDGGSRVASGLCIGRAVRRCPTSSSSTRS